MPESLEENLVRLSAPPPEFWEDDLELGLDYVLADVKRDGFTEQWVNKCTGRQINMICTCLDTGSTGSVVRKKEHLCTCEDRLLPFVLVDQYAKYKSKVAVVDFAKGVLGKEILDACCIKEEDKSFDKTALLFAIYHRKPTDLRLVFHLDKIHKTGFARMTLSESTRKPQQSLGEFLKPGAVRKILEAFDKSKRDGRTSEFKDVVKHDSRYFVFIRRAERPDLVLREGRIVHGYRPEWIILDFEDGAKRVNISSVSIGVPLQIANRIASAYFDKVCEYVNESKITYSKQIERFLKILREQETNDFLLVEVIVASSPLEGSPKVKITDSHSNPIGKAIGHFEEAVGSILSDIDKIESIKVYYRKKRVSLIFEKQDGTQDEYVIRYSDHRLNALERREFEKYMKDTHGIPVLSTEKRYKRET